MKRTYTTPAQIGDAICDLSLAEPSLTVDVHTRSGYYLTDKPITATLSVDDERRVLIGERFGPSLLLVVENVDAETHSSEDIRAFLHAPSNAFVPHDERGVVDRITVSY